MKINPLLALFADQPVLLSAEHRSQVLAYLEAAAAHPDITRMLDETAATNDDGFWPDPQSWKAPYRPYAVVNGILQIPVKGMLLNSFSFATSFATGYEYIWRAYERGMDDGSVRGIALVCHSPGGLVAGNQDLVDKMHARRDEKPVRAFAHEMAASAAYNVASVAPHIAMSRTAIVGSIGVRTTHIDWSKFNEKMGLEYTFIFAGEGKIDGDPDLPLSKDAKDRMQARIDELYEVFVSSVARNRGIKAETIRKDLKAYVYGATQAVSNGLANSIGSLDDAVAAFAADLSSTSGDEQMSIQDNAGGVDQAAHETAVTAARQDGHTAGLAEGAQAERTRISAILGSEEAKGREELAQHFVASGMAADAAIAALKVAPKGGEPEKELEEANTSETPFNAAMSNGGNPEVGASAKKGGEGKGQDDIIASLDGLGVIAPVKA